jgi:SH3-like domain-containing protein
VATSREVALKSAGVLIAGTFDSLSGVEGSDDAAPSETEVTVVAAVESAAPEAIGAREIEATPQLALAKRTVTSVPVGNDGQPEWPMVARSAPETVSAAAGAARDVAVVQTTEVEPLAFVASAAAAPQPQDRPEASTPVPEIAETEAGPVTVRTAVNVRSGPSGSHRRLFALAAGVEVEATHAQNGWVRIDAGENRVGWAYSDYLDNVDLEALPAPEADDVQVAVATEAPAAAGDARTVKGQGVNVRSGPSSSNGKLFALKGGAKVTVTDEQRGWLKVTDADGRSGWVYQQFLSGG